jgi:hypothetical protein
MDPKKILDEELILDASVSESYNEELNDAEFDDRQDDDMLLGGCRGRHCHRNIDKL